VVFVVFVTRRHRIFITERLQLRLAAL